MEERMHLLWNYIRVAIAGIIATGSVVAQPVNDDCAAAISIGDGTFEFSNVGATTDGPGVCAPSSEIWYTYTATCTGKVTARTCNTTFDTSTAAYVGAGCLGTQIICDVGGFGACGNQSSRITFSVIAGSQYTIAVGGDLDRDQGSGDLIVSCNSYDNCSGALTVGEGIFPFSNVGANSDGPATCAELGSDLWFLYRPSFVGSASISTCTPARTFDTALAVVGGCDGEVLLCSDDDLSRPECGDGGSTIRIRLVPTATYLIQVGGHAGAQGEAELVIRSCLGDFDGDGQVALSDLAVLLSDFGTGCGAAGCPPSDMDRDGDIDLTDLAIMLDNFATICP